MVIGFDARLYGAKQGGLGRYVAELIKVLEILDTVNEYRVFLTRQNWDEYTPVNPRWRKVLADIPWYGWREQLFFPLLLRKNKMDLMFFPHWNIPWLFQGKFVVAIHDLILLHYPSRRASTLGSVKYWLKNLFFKMTLRHAVFGSEKIIVPSNWVKDDLIKKLSVPQAKIEMIYEGAGAISPIPENAAEIRNRYGVNEKYLLCVGVAYPHKNLEMLIAAFKIFYHTYSRDYQLVLVGKRNYFYERLERAVILEKNLPIIFTDYVPDGDLPAFYQGAWLYIFPSLCEGFGLPGLEAMSYGLPVASSNRASLPEVYGEAAAYFDPEKPEEMAMVFHRALTDTAWRKNLIEKGLNQAKKYSWLKCGEKTLQVFKTVV